MSKKITFDDLEAIQMAGGVEGFVREVLAESKTVWHAQYKGHQFNTIDTLEGAIVETVLGVIDRRLEPDFKAISIDRIAKLNPPTEKSKLDAFTRITERIMDDVCKQSGRLIEIIFKKMGTRYTEIA